VPKVSAFVTLRRARADARLIGKRAKRAKSAAEKKELSQKNEAKGKQPPPAKGAKKGGDGGKKGGDGGKGKEKDKS